MRIATPNSLAEDAACTAGSRTPPSRRRRSRAAAPAAALAGTRSLGLRSPGLCERNGYNLLPHRATRWPALLGCIPAESVVDPGRQRSPGGQSWISRSLTSLANCASVPEAFCARADDPAGERPAPRTSRAERGIPPRAGGVLGRRAGLTSPHVGSEWGGLGLDHRGKAVVFEARRGYSPLGPIALNCFAPDEANMHPAGEGRHRGAERGVPAPACCRRHPLLLYDDRAGARRQGPIRRCC